MGDESAIVSRHKMAPSGAAAPRSRILIWRRGLSERPSTPGAGRLTLRVTGEAPIRPEPFDRAQDRRSVSEVEGSESQRTSSCGSKTPHNNPRICHSLDPPAILLRHEYPKRRRRMGTAFVGHRAGTLRGVQSGPVSQHHHAQGRMGALFRVQSIRPLRLPRQRQDINLPQTTAPCVSQL